MKKVIKIAFFCLTGLFFYMPLHSQFIGFMPMKDTAAYNARMNDVSKKTNTIESDFVQKKVMSVLADEVISKGHFIYKKPDRVCWEYTDPNKYLILISGEKIIIRNDKKQNEYDMKTSKAFQKVNRIMSGLMQGDIQNIKKDFKVEYFENDKLYLVNLVPKSVLMKQFFHNIEIYTDRESAMVGSIRINEPSGDYTLIEFLKRVVNTEVPDERFNAEK